MAERNELIKKLKISERSNQVLREALEALEEKNMSRSGGGEDDTNTLKSVYKSVGLSGGVGSSSGGTRSGGSGESSGEKALLLQPRKELLGEKSSRISTAPALGAGAGAGTALTTYSSRRQQQEESQQGESRSAQIARITTEQKCIQKKIKNLKQILSVAKMDNYLQSLPSHHGLEKLALEMETLELRSNECRKEMRELQIQVVTTTNFNSKKNGQHYEKIKLKSPASTSSSIFSSSSASASSSSSSAAAAAAASSLRDKRSSPYQSTTTSSFSSSPSSYSSLVDAGSHSSRNISRVAASVALHRFYSKRAPEKTVRFFFFCVLIDFKFFMFINYFFLIMCTLTFSVRTTFSSSSLFLFLLLLLLLGDGRLDA